MANMELNAVPESTSTGSGLRWFIILRIKRLKVGQLMWGKSLKPLLFLLVSIIVLSLENRKVQAVMFTKYSEIFGNCSFTNQQLWIQIVLTLKKSICCLFSWSWSSIDLFTYTSIWYLIDFLFGMMNYKLYLSGIETGYFHGAVGGCYGQSYGVIWWPYFCKT